MSLTKEAKDTSVQKPTRELVQFLYWLKVNMEFSPDLCIDVGARVGTAALYRSFPEAKHIVIEHDPKMFKALRKEIKPYNSEHIEANPSSRNNDSAAKLDDLLKGKLSGSKYIMRVAELGRDNEVLIGATNVIAQCDVVIVKTPLYRFWGPDQADFFDVIEFMKSKGFVVFDMIGGLFKANNRALGQLELAFVKENGDLRPHHHW